MQGAYRGCPYMIMEYLDVGTLGDWITRYADGTRDSLRVCIEILVKVCRVLAYLHRHGIVHRDLKPDNVLLAEFADNDNVPNPAQVRVSDFGLVADLTDDRELSRTKTCP